MGSQFPPLTVRRHHIGLEVVSDLEDGRFAVHLAPGEEFGGRMFEEWMRVADSHGTVSSDWLDV